MAANTAVRGHIRLSRCSDDELLDLARVAGTDSGAYEELYRRHETAARNVARYLLRSRHDADDVVNDAFAGVIAAINHGAGPRTNFRQYLMACVRNGCKSRRNGKTVATDPSVMERHSAVFEDPDRFSEAGIVANAFSSLSVDWQRTLWLTAVEQQPTEEVARQLGRKPAAVAALAHRAREAFAEAYLAQHQQRTTDASCERVSAKLAHYVRGHCGEIDTIRVEQHLSDCVACSCAVAELRDLNSALRSLTGPAPLVAGATATVAATALGGSALLGGGVAGLLGGAAVLKAAVIGALLIPAAIVTVRAVENDDSSNRTIAAAVDDDANASASASDDAVVVTPDDETTATASTVADASDDADEIDAAAASADQAESPSTTHRAPAAVSDVASADGTADETTAGAPASSIVVGPITVGVGGSGSGTGQPTAAVSAGADSNGVHVGVGVTVPIVTVPVAIDVTLPPVTVPSVSTPAIVVPEIVVPAVSLPLITTPPITVPSITVPSISTPAITLPPVSVPTITVPALPLPAITLPGIPQLFP